MVAQHIGNRRKGPFHRESAYKQAQYSSDLRNNRQRQKLFQKIIDNLQTVGSTNGLGKESIATCLHSQLAVGVESIGGKCNYRQVGQHALDLLGSSQAIHLGHLQVHQNQVRMLSRGLIYSLLSVTSAKILIVALENKGHQQIIAVIIFCNEDTFHRFFLN